MAEPSPRPWKRDGWNLFDANGTVVGCLLGNDTGSRAKANGDAIVRCVNAAEEMAEALRHVVNRENYQGTGEPWPHLFEKVRTALDKWEDTNG